MNRYLIPALGILLSLSVTGYAAEPAGSGITFPLTRVIYPESAGNGITFTVTNNTDRVYLLQSRVIPAEAETDGPVPFIVIPPLTRFEPGAAVTLLIRRSGSVAETDRELLWRLALKAIPAQQSASGAPDGDAVLVLALQNNLKLFYRPDSIAAPDTAERAAQLQFSQQGGYLTVTNPAPYYVTFSELQADGRAVETGGNRMLAPHSTVRYPVQRQVSSVSWSVTGDDGRQTGPHSRRLN